MAEPWTEEPAAPGPRQAHASQAAGNRNSFLKLMPRWVQSPDSGKVASGIRQLCPHAQTRTVTLEQSQSPVPTESPGGAGLEPAGPGPGVDPADQLHDGCFNQKDPCHHRETLPTHEVI